MFKKLALLLTTLAFVQCAFASSDSDAKKHVKHEKVESEKAQHHDEKKHDKHHKKHKKAHKKHDHEHKHHDEKHEHHDNSESK